MQVIFKENFAKIVYLIIKSLNKKKENWMIILKKQKAMSKHFKVKCQSIMKFKIKLTIWKNSCRKKRIKENSMKRN